jgi:hypothetical protein
VFLDDDSHLSLAVHVLAGVVYHSPIASVDFADHACRCAEILNVLTKGTVRGEAIVIVMFLIETKRNDLGSNAGR